MGIVFVYVLLQPFLFELECDFVQFHLFPPRPTGGRASDSPSKAPGVVVVGQLNAMCA